MFTIDLGHVPPFTEPESWALVFALVFVLMDMLVGTVCAFAMGRRSSTKLREGLFHKAQELMVIALAVLVQPAVTLIGGVDLPGAIVLPVCVAIILMEVGSCLENIGEANPQLKDSGIFKLFSNNGDKDEGD